MAWKSPKWGAVAEMGSLQGFLQVFAGSAVIASLTELC